jgi:hypothetical protein
VPHPCRFFARKNRGKGGTQRRESGIFSRLVVVLEVWVMTMVVMVMAVYDYNHLRLRRIGYREAEEKGDSEQSFLHSLV